MPNYVRPLSGYYLNMFFLVLHTLHLLVFTRGSRVIDEYNQAVDKNKYCSKIAECLPGTHVMCMYGNTTAMNPRCAEGKVLPLEDIERNLFLDIFNGFRRDLASGKEILGKDDFKLPRARNMRKLFWDSDLETFAQAWANQCQVERDQCHSTDNYPRPGQMVGIVRFSYPDWSPNRKLTVSDSGPSLEKRQSAIETFTKTIFSAHKDVTLSMIQKAIGLSGPVNVYLLSVYASSSHIGCAMSSFVDYQLSLNTDTHYYNAIILVCNFSSRPQIGEPIYMTNRDGPCTCIEGFKNESCLCVPGEPKNTQNPDLDRHIDGDQDLNGTGEKCPAVSPFVAVLPIVDVHDADLKQQKNIKDRLQNARDQYFCNHGSELETRFFDGGPVDQDSFLKSEFDPDYKKSNLKRKERDLDLTIPSKLHIQLKPEFDISDMNENLLHSHQNVIKDNSRTDEANRLFNDMRKTAAAKVYVTSINGKPVKYPFENFQKTQRISTRTLPYGMKAFSNTEPNVFITSINGKPVKYHYDEQFKKSQKPSTRDSSYGVKGFNYKESPYLAISNDDHDQLIRDLYTREQELIDMRHNSYIDEIFQKIMRRTGEKTTNKDNILITKQIEKGDLMDNISSKVFTTDNKDTSNIDNLQKTIETEIDYLSTTNQMMHKHQNNNEGNTQTEKANRIFKDMRNTAAAEVYETSVNGKPLKLHLQDIQNSERLNTRTLPYHREFQIYGTSINGEPKTSQKSSTRVLSYDVQDSNDKESPYTISNDDHEQLLSVSQEQELKDMLYNIYVKEIGQEKLRTTGEDITNKDNILITKQIGDLIYKSGSKMFDTNNQQKIIEMEIDNRPKKNQNHKKGNSQTEEANQIFNDMRKTAANKVYVKFVNSKPVKYPLENIQNSQRNTRNFPYGEQGISNQGQPKIDITNASSNGKPEDYHSDEKFRNYRKSPYTTMSNDDLDQLLRDLFTEKQELLLIMLKNYIHEMEKKISHTTGKDITNKDNIITKKQRGKGATGMTASKVSAIDKDDPSKTDNEPIERQINNWPTRNQVPLHIHAYGTNNFDYYRHFHATKEFVKPRATLINHDNENEQDNANHASNGDSPGKNRLFDYDVYVDMLKHMQ